MKKTTLVAAVLLGVSVLAGCGDQVVNPDVIAVDIQVDMVTPSDNGSDETVRPDTSVEDREVACIAGFGYAGEQENPELGADMVMTENQTRTIPIFYRDCDGNDSDRAVVFEQLDGDEYCELQVATAFTDDEGIAYAGVKSFNKLGFCHIQACAEDVPDTCVTVTIYVDQKVPTPLRVRFGTYSGNYPMLSTGKVRLYKHTEENAFSCADMDPNNLPTPATLESASIAIVNGIAVFTTLLGLKDEKAQDYTIVGQAYEKDSSELRAWACDDVNGHVELGGVRDVTLNLIDLIPSIKGRWDIHSEFDLISGLPPTVEKIINVLIGLFVSPTGQILMLMCDEDLIGLNIGNDICGYIFADPEEPVLGEYGAIGSFVVNIIDQIIINLLVNNCPYEDNPELCGTIYFTGKDIGQILQKFRIDSTMTCDNDARIDWSNPEAGAIISKGDCREIWHTIWFRWTYGKDCDPQDDDCGYDAYNMSAIPGIEEAINADISGRITDGQYLHIDQHAVNLKYGAIINFLLENILLPQVFGPTINSYEKLIGSLLAGQQCVATMSCCQDFDNTLTAKYTWLPAGLAEGACDALLDTVVGYIRTELNGLDATPENFTLGTPVDTPARIVDNDRDMLFDNIADRQNRATWEANLKIGSSVYDPVGLFWGERN